MKASIGLRFLAATCCEGDLENYLAAGKTEHLFNAGEMQAFEYIASHVIKYGALPKLETVGLHSDADLEKPPEPALYYLEHLKQRYMDLGLRNSVVDATKLLKGDDKDPRAAVLLMFDACVDMLRTEKSAHLFDFRDALTPVMAEHNAKLMGLNVGIDLGWEYLDRMIGGIRKGDLVSYVGRPQKGKTWFMLYSALHAWEKQSKTVMFCTFEMEGRLIRERLAAMYGHVPAMNLKLGELTTLDRKKMISKLTTAKQANNPLWILDAGMATTIPELLAISRSLKPDVIYLDGAYLIQHENTRLDRFRKIDAIADQIKTILCPLAPTLASWQYNKAAAKKKKDDPVTADDVYGSDVIFMVSSILLGIFQADTPETIHRKLIQIQKGRGGEKGEFETCWDFRHMDFSQYVEKDEDKELDHTG
ncbi:hypothetical protein LCGC14_2005090 [marine sediment metagenome]|uniref:SF4 helicase domain-containing protein n=1 Tax=marine sediment metagenome TaxID=412755 RepID=A0A0F9FPM8_9ZZZZ